MSRASTIRCAGRISLNSAALALTLIGHSAPLVAQEAGGLLKVIVPYVAGSGPDILARLVGEELHQSWKQPVIVENQPGASGNIGTEAVARSKPDGKTILLTASPLTQNVALFKSVPYDPVKSFQPIAMIAEGFIGLAVNPTVPANSAKQFVDFVKARPGRVNYASPGRGTPQHLSMELFKLSTGTDIQHVPYKGMPAAIQDVVGNHVSAAFVPIHIAVPLAKSNQIRLLAVASKQRVDVAPDVPTLNEQGIAGVELDFWFGVLAPAGTPRDFVDRANAEINRIIRLPHIKEKLTGQGLIPTGGSVQDFVDFLPKDLAKWRRIIEAAKLGEE
jgi:tripartite-type tricarboxylate transporter receptor subunit TctC